MKKLFYPLLFISVTSYSQASYPSSNPTIGYGILQLLLFIALFLFIFLLLREVWCWYWKINKHISKQDEIIKELHAINDKLSTISNITALKDAGDLLADDIISQEEFDSIKNSILSTKEQKIINPIRK